jgi:hypothetical protein
MAGVMGAQAAAVVGWLGRAWGQFLFLYQLGIF